VSPQAFQGEGFGSGGSSSSSSSAVGGLVFALLASAQLATQGQKSGDASSSYCRCESVKVRRVVIARDSDIADGDLKQIRVPPTADGGSEGAILLAKIDGKLYATGASCSHYSAPLAQGVAAKDKMHVVCPWHNAAFDLRTGQPVRGSGLPAIPVYPVCVEGGNIVAELPFNMEDFVKPKVAKRCPNDGRVFLVIGGGAAGVAAVDALRQGGFTGQVTMLTEETHLPYDRPVLSKNLAKGAEPKSLALRDEAHFQEHEIDIRFGAAVKELRADEKIVQLVSGEEIKYDAALVATGAKPRLLPIPGGNLPGVMALRTPEDAQRIGAACGKGKKVIVIGSSFIGMEIAATLNRRGCDVTVLGMETVPFERVLGIRVGDAIKNFFEEKGVTFMGSSSVTEITQTEGSGLTASLKSGQKLTCDAVIVGVGVIPNCEFVSGVEKARDGSLVTDEHLKTSGPCLYAAGDVAQYRSPSGDQLRVEHWDVATSQGRLAAKCMLGETDTFDQTPFFWTSLFGKNLRYVGHCMKFDEFMVDGDLKKLTFVAYYCQNNEVKAVATMGRDPVAVAAGELMRMGKMPSAEDFKSGKATAAGLADRLRELNCAGS